MSMQQKDKASRYRALTNTFGLFAVLIAASAAAASDPGWMLPYESPQLPERWIEVSAVIFGAAVVSSTVGFAFAAIAAAMILYWVPDGLQAVRIMMIASIGIQLYSVAGLWQAIRWSRCVPFVAGGIVTLPIGIFLVTQINVEPRWYALALGAVVVAYGLVMLAKRPVSIETGERPVVDALVGALGGITGPLAAFPAIGVTIWCSMRGWDKVAQRAVYQPYILIMQIVALVGLVAVSQQTQQAAFDPVLLLYAIPGLAGAVIGMRIFQSLTNLQFQHAVNLALVVSGIALVMK